MHASHSSPFHLPAGAFHATARLRRVIVVAVLLGICGLGIYRTAQREAELTRYRSTMQELSSTLRAMRAQAIARRRTIQLSLDPAHGAFQLMSVRPGRHRSYDTVERTLWLPAGLQILEGPPFLTALPSGRLSAATIVVAAPAYQRVFRLTTRESGGVQLDEEPTL